jgi:excisionase family DNA binding protein
MPQDTTIKKPRAIRGSLIDTEQALFLSLTQTAKLLGKSKSHVGRLIKTGEIPSVKMGQWPLVPRQWVYDLVADVLAKGVQG